MKYKVGDRFEGDCDGRYLEVTITSINTKEYFPYNIEVYDIEEGNTYNDSCSERYLNSFSITYTILKQSTLPFWF